MASFYAIRLMMDRIVKIEMNFKTKKPNNQKFNVTVKDKRTEFIRKTLFKHVTEEIIAENSPSSDRDSGRRPSSHLGPAERVLYSLRNSWRF